MATDTLKRLSGPTLLTASAANQYTVPGSTTATLRNIHVANETATAATITCSIGPLGAADGSGKRLWTAVPIPANGHLDWTGLIVLNATDVIWAFSGTASALTLAVSGVETSPSPAGGSSAADNLYLAATYR